MRLCHFVTRAHKHPEVCQKTNRLSNPPAQEKQTAEKSEAQREESQSVGNLQATTPLTSARACSRTHGRRLRVPQNMHSEPITQINAKWPALSAKQAALSGIQRETEQAVRTGNLRNENSPA